MSKNPTESNAPAQQSMFEHPDFGRLEDCSEAELQGRLAGIQTQLDTLTRVARVYDSTEDRLDRREAYGQADNSELTQTLAGSGFTTRSELGSRLQELRSQKQEIERLLEPLVETNGVVG